MSTIGNMLNLATALPQLALNATPEGMAANLLKNVGDQMVNDIASKLTNLLFSGGLNGNNNTFMSPQSQGGASMGNTLAASNMQQMLQQVIQQMGVNSQNSPFNSQAGAGNMNAFNGGLSHGLQSPSTGIGLVQLPLSTTGSNSANSFNQLGNNMGSQLGSKMGLQALDDVKSDTSGLCGALGGGGKVEGGSKETRAEIGKFMDQHPEIYGKPQSVGAGMPGLVHIGKGPSSWEDALKNSKPLSGDALKAFQSAKNDLKTSMVGGSIAGSGTTPGSSSLLMNADAQLFNSNIIQNSLKHHHGAILNLAALA